MPTYTYQCKECGHKTDVFHSMTVKPRVKCPACGNGCIRLFGSGAGIIFKGSGFYQTDYKKSGADPGPKSEAGKSEAKAESKTEAKAESKTDTKTDTKSDTKTGSKSDSKPSASSQGN